MTASPSLSEQIRDLRKRLFDEYNMRLVASGHDHGLMVGIDNRSVPAAAAYNALADLHYTLHGKVAA